ncbi:hypothetical protein QJQ59_05950, partial (plasmid) [Klebsiella michiganensis]
TSADVKTPTEFPPIQEKFIGKFKCWSRIKFAKRVDQDIEKSIRQVGMFAGPINATTNAEKVPAEPNQAAMSSEHRSAKRHRRQADHKYSNTSCRKRIRVREFHHTTELCSSFS